jgi:hypothetical protein
MGEMLKSHLYSRLFTSVLLLGQTSLFAQGYNIQGNTQVVPGTQEYYNYTGGNFNNYDSWYVEVVG